MSHGAGVRKERSGDFRERQRRRAEKTEEKGLSGTLKGVGEGAKKLFSGQGTPPPSDNRSSPFGGGGP